MEGFMGHGGRFLMAVMALCAATLVGGCGVTRKITVGQMVPILKNATEGARERTDLHLIAQAIPANLLLVDGLIRSDPDNRGLLAISAFLHFSYALGFVEDDSLELASEYYAAGRDHGLRALEHRREFRDGRAGTPADFARGVESLRRKDVEAMAWAAANWGRWISLNLESPAAIAQQPQLEALMTRLLELEPTFEYGLPHVLRGMYDALRPEMLGGQPDSAALHFDRAFELSKGENQLYRVLYAEYYCRQVLDEECFETSLQQVESAGASEIAAFRMMNEIARRRARRLRAMREEWF
jgi:hypothetical protein